MRKLLSSALCAFVVFIQTPALAHGTWGYDWWPSISNAKRHRIVSLTHNKFVDHGVAHKMLLLFDCESQFRWWIRGAYDGMPQASESFRRAYSPRIHPGWSIKEQVLTARNGFRARGFSPWPNCPDEARG